jgi:hypothetical protein
MMTSESLMAYPLSSAQLELWFAQMIDRESSIYNIGGYIEIHGSIDPLRFEMALRQVVAESESLRVRFVDDLSGPRQVIEAAVEWSLLFSDFSAELDPQVAAEA